MSSDGAWFFQQCFLFQVLNNLSGDPWSQNYFTVFTRLSWRWALRVRMSSLFSIHCSWFQPLLTNRAELPSLTSQKLCLWMRFWFSWVDFQILEPERSSRNHVSICFSQWWAYLVCQSFALGSSSYVIHFHHIFSPIALLVSSGSWSPIPPTFLGLQTIFQSTNGHFLWILSPPHKKFLWIFLICLITNFGAARTDKR